MVDINIFEIYLLMHLNINKNYLLLYCILIYLVPVPV